MTLLVGSRGSPSSPGSRERICSPKSFQSPQGGPPCPCLQYLDLDQCPELSPEVVWSLVQPQVKSWPASTGSETGQPSITYEMLRAENGFQLGEKVEIVDFWATEDSLRISREAMEAVRITEELAADKVAEAARLASVSEEAAAAAAETEAQAAAAKGGKAVKAAEAAVAARTAAEAAAAEATKAAEVAEAAKAAAAAAPEAARGTAKLSFTYLFRSLSSPNVAEFSSHLDADAFQPAALDSAEEKGILVVWPSKDASLSTQILQREAARMKFLEAVQTCRRVRATTSGSLTRSHWHLRACEELRDALECADGLLRGGLEDFPLLRSAVGVGLMEFLPDLEMQCLLGCGARVKVADYQMHEVRCSHLREQRQGDLNQ